MSITLITAVPGGGKTIYAVWHEIREACKQERVVYTSAIPELKFPTVRVGYKDIHKWHETEYKNKHEVNVPDEERERSLVNFQEGSMIVIDEVQYCWPASGTKVTPDIEYLTLHRKHGISFVLITQAPHLIHKNVLAVVDRHIHIRNAWFGRHTFEWPEYCSTPRAMSSRMAATKKGYKIPKEAYGTYRSASLHVKPQKSVPIAVYFMPLLFLIVPFIGWKAYSSVMNKTNPVEIEQPLAINNDSFSVPTYETAQNSLETPIPEHKPLTEPIVSNQVDWDKVGSCIASDSKCICFGLSNEHLSIPPETCRTAVVYGWPSNRPTYDPNPPSRLSNRVPSEDVATATPQAGGG